MAKFEYGQEVRVNKPGHRLHGKTGWIAADYKIDGKNYYTVNIGGKLQGFWESELDRV